MRPNQANIGAITFALSVSLANAMPQSNKPYPINFPNPVSLEDARIVQVFDSLEKKYGIKTAPIRDGNCFYGAKVYIDETKVSKQAMDDLKKEISDKIRRLDKCGYRPIV